MSEQKPFYKDGLRLCSSCEEYKDVASFRKKKGDRLDGLSCQCSDCVHLYSVKYYQENRDKRLAYSAKYRIEKPKSKEEVRAMGLWSRHRMTVEEFDSVLLDQKSVCAACGSEDYGWSGAWNIDHDHRCCPRNRSCVKCRRALLCSKCNMILGYCNDNPDHLEKLIGYIKEWNV